jgi:hypothetical protein
MLEFKSSEIVTRSESAFLMSSGTQYVTRGQSALDNQIPVLSELGRDRELESVGI